MGEKGARLTDASVAFQDDVIARLEPLGGVTSRKMFGGFGIFHNGAMFAIISKSTLFFKVDDTTVADYRKAGSRQHEPMPYYAVPSSVLSKNSALHKWARAAMNVARSSSQKKAKKAASKKK